MEEKGPIAKALQYLLDREKLTVKELSRDTGIPATTIYSMLGKKTAQADILTLRTLARHFGEDLSIFCDPEGYERPIELSAEERVLLASYRGLTELGRERLTAYIEDIRDNPKYVLSARRKDS